MKQEDKNLLLKDLCARLPHGVKCHIGEKNPYTLSSVSNDYDGILIRFKEQKNGFNMEVYLSEVKPYLFPLSSMTEEQYNTLHKLGYLNNCNHSYQLLNPNIHKVSFKLETIKTFSLELINWLLENHFDIHGLIPMGLAIDATGLNIY